VTAGPEPPSGWTVETLRAHLLSELAALFRLLAEMDLRYEQRYVAQSKALEAALLAAEKAVLKAETAAERRFESVNEFRAQLSDQAGTFIPRSEHGVQMKATEDRLSRIDDALKAIQIWQGNIAGRLAVLGAVFAVFVTLVVFGANYVTRK